MPDPAAIHITSGPAHPVVDSLVALSPMHLSELERLDPRSAQTVRAQLIAADELDAGPLLYFTTERGA